MSSASGNVRQIGGKGKLNKAKKTGQARHGAAGEKPKIP